ncbi:MAG: hypothetical protein CMN30_11895 [Sandaracinus sp.]|nr:hypothetical protein [Sandaracinus sp.]
MQQSSPTRIEGRESKAKGPRLDVGSLLDDRYRLLGEIGEGGMGRVYEAYDETRGQMVAVKVMSPKWANDDKARARFMREVEATKRIRHPNVVEVYGAGFCDEEQNRPYLAMERLYGTSLWHYVHCPVQGHGPVDVPMAVDLMEQAAQALEATHEAGVIHRDVKPENFLLTRGPNDEPIIKLLDFGLVQVSFGEGPKLTEEGTFVGTPEYMAPELAFGHPASPRTDVYGLASAFYELVTGKMAFSGKTHFEIISKKQKNRAPTLSEGNGSLEFSPAMEDVIARALSRSPEKRQENPSALARELRRTLEGKAPQTENRGAAVAAAPRAPKISEHESGPRRRAPALSPDSVALRAVGDRRPRRIAVAVVAILAVLGGLGYAAYTGAFHTEGSETGAAPAAQEPVRVAAAGEEPEPMFDLDVDGNGAGVNDEAAAVETVPAEVASGADEAAAEAEPEAPAPVAAAPEPVRTQPARAARPAPARRAARRAEPAAQDDLAALADRADAVAEAEPASEPVASAEPVAAAPAEEAPAEPSAPESSEPDVSAAIDDAMGSIDEIDLESSLL